MKGMGSTPWPEAQLVGDQARQQKMGPYALASLCSQGLALFGVAQQPQRALGTLFNRS
jgi:hypothetical protein